jgi:hypothetical protein
MLFRILMIVLVASWSAACRTAEEEVALDVAVIVDGEEKTYSFSRDLSVDQVLANAQIELGPRDRISHPIVSPVVDGMRITIRRVSEKQVCEQEEIDFQRRRLPKEGVPAGELQPAQAGIPGLREVCYRILLEDETEVDRLQLGVPTKLREPVDEIIFESPANVVQAIAIAGRLSYINHQNAWTITLNAANKRILTTEHRLDSLVFQQRDDGAYLIFTSETNETDEFFNELWLISTDDNAEAIRMTPTDVLFAEWRPRTSNKIAYSTGERSLGAAGWKALNNLWLMSIDLESARTLNIEEVLPESNGGLYGWWGKNFAWAPLGDKLAWAQADGFGLVDFENRRLTPLVQYAVFHSAATWVWLTALSWSFDGQLLAGIAHGAPLGDEPPETSPIFDVVVASADGRFSAPVSSSAGMWAAPAFSPNISARGAKFATGYLAWLQAREPQNSMSGEYDLILADRDGSNQRRLFPPSGQPGIRKSDFGVTARQLTWSPGGRFLALIYEGDLWLLEVETTAAYQVTFDGQTSNPIWTS